MVVHYYAWTCLCSCISMLQYLYTEDCIIRSRDGQQEAMKIGRVKEKRREPLTRMKFYYYSW